MSTSMDKLRRALIRGAIVGVFFALVILGITIFMDGPHVHVGEVLTILGLVSFETAFIVAPLSLVEFRGAERPPTIGRDLAGFGLGLFLGTFGVMLASLQGIYVQAMLDRHDPVRAMNEASRMLREIGERPELVRAFAAVALPFGFVTVGRMRRLAWFVETPLSIVLSAVFGALLIPKRGSGIEPFHFVLTGGAGAALSIGTRLADFVAAKIAARLERDEPREADAGPRAP